jgi:hypothetical protein
VVKEIHCDVDDPAQKLSYQRQIQVLATMEHPALLGLHDKREC